MQRRNARTTPPTPEDGGNNNSSSTAAGALPLQRRSRLRHPPTRSPTSPSASSPSSLMEVTALPASRSTSLSRQQQQQHQRRRNRSSSSSSSAYRGVVLALVTVLTVFGGFLGGTLWTLHNLQYNVHNNASRLSSVLSPREVVWGSSGGGGGGGGVQPMQQASVDTTTTRSSIWQRGLPWQRPRNQIAAAAGPPPQLPTSSNDLIDMRELTATLSFDNVDGGAWKQGWNVAPRTVDTAHPLTVLVIPHSHCDPGWLKTFDEYFQSQTSHIITTVVNALAADQRRTFVWAEISYFSWWWEEQDAKTRQLVKTLLDNKQLEFVTGGWVQPDEANSELFAMEIQLQEGHDWITTHLGGQYVPRHGWSIDPFGYSPTMAYLLQQYHFKGMLIQRVHYAVKKELARRQHLEFLWRQTWDDQGTHDILTHVMPFFSYDVPHTCGPDPAVCCQFDFARAPIGSVAACPWHHAPQVITDANVRERALLLLDQYQKKAALYRSNVLLVPLGDDFRYQTSHEAEAQFVNHAKIHDYLNANVPGVQVKFGTLSEYFDLITGQFTPPVLKGSFFTYSDVNQDYWSGYFTSRVSDKALDRRLERALYAATRLGATPTELQRARRELSLFQHHDGVTGTARDHVVQDYAARMQHALVDVQTWMLHQAQAQYRGATNDADKMVSCWMTRGVREMPVNVCEALDTSNGAAAPMSDNKVIAYNPLDTPQTCGNDIVPGVGFAQVTLPCEVAGAAVDSKTKFVFDKTTGLLKKPVREEWKVWKVNAGGAYLFVPGQLLTYDVTQHDVKIEDDGFIVTTPAWKRTLIEREVESEDGSTGTVLDFVYEFQLDTDNEEWFVRFSGNIANRGVFHTDLNGFNFDTHHFRHDLPIQSQVFPMPTLASIDDDTARLTVLSEHAQGTASLQEGAVDVWLDRRLQQDDARGLGQGVQDNVRTRTRLRVILEHENYKHDGEFAVTPLVRRMWDELQHPLQLFGKQRVTVDQAAALPADPYRAEQVAQQRRNVREQLRAERQKRRMSTDAAGGAIKSFSWWDYFFPSSTRQKEKRKKRRFSYQRGQSTYRSQSTYRYSPWEERGATAARTIANTRHTVENTDVPFVYMVYKRVDYLQQAMEYLRKSDYPRHRVPIIISHDGRVPDVVQYVESIKSEFNIIQLFHPYSCYEHPDSFPGDDKRLNDGYKGDSFGNKRSSWATCAKHHFTWMIKTVFELDLGGALVENAFFLEEDYIVAPTIYRAVVNGLNAMEELEPKTDGGFLGLMMDPTAGGRYGELSWYDPDSWQADNFHSGPMTISRKVFEQFREHAEVYCTVDDYNWDYSFMTLMGKRLMPRTVLVPVKTQAKHIGTKGGMHNKDGVSIDTRMDTTFRGTKFSGRIKVELEEHNSGWGGWGHPADHEHCLKLLKT